MKAIETIQAFMGESWQNFFLIVTYLGAIEAYIVLLTLYYWLIDPHSGRQLGILVSLASGITIFLKDWSDRDRPFDLNPNIAQETAKRTAEGEAFPSGHALGSTTFWFYLAWHHNRRWLWGLSLMIVSLISFSRVYLGVHFPIDIIVGFIIGLILVGIGILWHFPERKGLISGILIVSIAFAFSVLSPHLAISLGTLVGFFLTRPQFTPPSTWKGRLILASGGLILVFLLRTVSGWILDYWQLSDWMNYWRYLLITLLATEVCPIIIKY